MSNRSTPTADITFEKVDKASIRPTQSLQLLSQAEVKLLMASTKSSYQLLRRCVLAILNSNVDTDDASFLLKHFEDFKVRLVVQPRGIRLDLYQAPASAFVDGVMMDTLRQQVFAALRDIVFIQAQLKMDCSIDTDPSSTISEVAVIDDATLREEYEQAQSEKITDQIFSILRNAQIVNPNEKPNVVVCWGGHSISRQEYDYTKDLGYQLGLRGIDIATGSGPGAMKGPMKGATVGHAKQLHKAGRYVGITEPGIIAAESPNMSVNELVILPDIEKRLEAFVRLAHVLVVFPGGVGTLEEVLYILSIKMQSENAHLQLPLYFACGEDNTAYFERIDQFLKACLGDAVAQHYTIHHGDAAGLAQRIRQDIRAVTQLRRKAKASYSYQWSLHIPYFLQKPFEPTHTSMQKLDLSRSDDKGFMASQLRAAFSGIVAGNVKPRSVAAVEKNGPFKLSAEPEIARALNALLLSFVEEGRMSLSGEYKPCFEIQS